MTVDLMILAERRANGAAAWELAVPRREQPVVFFDEADPAETELCVESVEFDLDHRWAIRHLLGHYEHRLRNEKALPHHRGFPDDASADLRRVYSESGREGFRWSWAMVEAFGDFDWNRKPIVHWGNHEPSTAVDQSRSFRDLVGEAFFTQTLATLLSYGAPEHVRVVWCFY